MRSCTVCPCQEEEEVELPGCNGTPFPSFSRRSDCFLLGNRERGEGEWAIRFSVLCRRRRRPREGIGEGEGKDGGPENALEDKEKSMHRHESLNGAVVLVLSCSTGTAHRYDHGRV